MLRSSVALTLGKDSLRQELAKQQRLASFLFILCFVVFEIDIEYIEWYLSKWYLSKRKVAEASDYWNVQVFIAVYIQKLYFNEPIINLIFLTT